MDFEQIQDPVERGFWQGAARQELLIRYCMECDEPHWYPRPICPYCGHCETVFRRAQGTGTIYSLTRLRAKDRPPRLIAYVSLDEGITMLSEVQEPREGAAAIGQRVAVAFVEDKNGLQRPVFRPIELSTPEVSTIQP